MRQCCTVVELYNNKIIIIQLLYFIKCYISYLVKALVQLMTRH